MNRFLLLFCAAFALCFAPASPAQSTNNFNNLPGLIFEAEEWSTPRDGWLTNQVSATKWRLWTTEGPGKRSRNAALVSPRIEKDRTTPEEGAPVLHTHITGIPHGVYRALLGPTTRPLAYSLDEGKHWLKSTSGETELGVYDIQDGTFNLWVDDRFANPASIGSAYYDYIRLVAYTPPQVSGLAAFTLPDGNTQLTWISNEPTPPAVIELAAREFPETGKDLRNHRVVLSGLEKGKSYEARLRLPGMRSEPLEFIAGDRPHIRGSKAQTFELTVTEPTAVGRTAWPVTSGVPFAQGTLADARDAHLHDADGHPVPTQLEPLAYWPDGSIKWLQTSFLTSTSTNSAGTLYHLCIEPRPQPPVQTDLVVRDQAGVIVLENRELSVTIRKDRFALFDGIKLRGQPVTGDPMGGNGRIVDAHGKIFSLGAPDEVRIEESGPIRAVVRVSGDFVAADGAKLFRWQARYSLCAGQPWLKLSWTIGNNNVQDELTNLQSAGLRLPLAGHGPLSGSFDNAPLAAIKDAESTWLLQEKDDHFTATTNGESRNGEHALGCATAADGAHRVTVLVKDFWQTYPKGIAIKPDGLHIRLLPPLPADAFAKESQNDEDLIRLYYCYDHGQYRIKRGLEFTTDLYVRFGTADSTATNDLQISAWFQQPLFAVAAPTQYCASGVFGLVEPSQPELFPSYEKQVESGFNKLELNRQQKHEYGWMNYGDWHGERHFNWGNHEYDMMGALALQFIRTGDLKWLWRADQSSRHSTDIDTIHYPWQERMAGRVYAHSVGHVGGFFDMTDPRFQRLGNIFGLSDPKRPNPFVAGCIDPGGHIFQPGNFRLGFLMAERRYLETAEMVCTAQATYMTAKFDFGIERAAGWPLMNAVAAYDATANPFYLNAARLYVEKILAKQTERGDWNLAHGPPECMHQPTHPGGKAFATGILLNGLMMFDSTTPSAEVKQCIIRSAHWLEKYSWNHEMHRYRYIDTCPTFESGGKNGGTDFLVSSGLAYACTLDPDPALQTLLIDSLSRAMTSGVSVGKDYTQDIRQTPHALAILHQKFGLKEFPEVKPIPEKK